MNLKFLVELTIFIVDRHYFSSHYCPLQDQQCAYNSSARAASCKGYKEIPQGNERALTTAVAKVGPVSVGIDAMQSTFLYYKSGT